jgi:hypothetical protein
MQSRPLVARGAPWILAAALAGCQRVPVDETGGPGGSSESGGPGESTATPTDTGSETTDEPTTGPAIPLGPCNPVDPAMCALPYPSTFHMRPADTPTGWQVAYTADALPKNLQGVPMDPKYLNEKDGFSVLGALLLRFDDVDLAGTIGHEDLGAYLDPDAKTLLIDAATGERVPHFVELDVTTDEPDERLIVVQPAVPLKHATRYVFAARGLAKAGGGLVEPSPGFASLRDGTGVGADLGIEAQRERYESEVFPALAAAGAARAELQVAWDFVTVSRENSLGRMIHLREDLLATIGEEGPPYTIKEVNDEDCAAPDAAIGRTILVEMTTPLYTTEDEPGSVLTRDPDTGMPFQNGETEVEVLVRIPCSLIAQPEPRAGRIVQYGHGLLGGKGEAQNGYLSRMADDNGWVIVASDWTGMKSEDVGAIAGVLTGDATNFATVPERSMQGFTEFVAAMRMVRGKFASDKSVFFTAGNGESYSVIDPERRSYYGNSQGGILGGAYLALSPDVERGVLGVGGMPYVLLLPRSADFTDFFMLMQSAYPDHRDIMLLIALFQNLWDPGEGAGWAWAMNREPDPAVGAKQVLMQVAIGDAQVTDVGAQIQARAFGAATVAPQTRPVWGVEEKPPGFTGSAYVEWSYSDVPPPPTENVPPSKADDPHECPRREPAAQQQLRDFLEDGVVHQYCEGKCEGVRAQTCP